MRIENGETKNYAESYLHNELAIIDTTDAKTDEVVAIPEAILARGDVVQEILFILGGAVQVNHERIRQVGIVAAVKMTRESRLRTTANGQERNGERPSEWCGGGAQHADHVG